MLDISAGWGEGLEDVRSLVQGGAWHAVDVSSEKWRALAQKGFVVYKLDVEGGYR